MENILFNLRLVEGVKSGIIRDAADIIEQSGCDRNEELKESAASCILKIMLLTKHCGIETEQLFESLLLRISTEIANGNPFETKFNDLSSMAKFIRRD